MTYPTPITEQSGIQNEWYATAKTMTIADLPEFIRHLTEDYIHDYGTICHAIAAASLATAHAIDRSEAGGISGFQSGAIMWQFIIRWTSNNNPLRLTDYGDMLYPQYREKFTSITPETWAWLQDRARDNLTQRSYNAVDPVVKHWKQIADGVIPFGFHIRES